jgi:hypothetical protein
VKLVPFIWPIKRARGISRIDVRRLMVLVGFYRT